MAIKRRDLIKLGAQGWVMTGSSLAYSASKNEKSSNKIVWVVLRGAMDSLHTVVPLFDKSLLTHRASLVEPIQDKLLPLDRGFGLHPSLKFCHSLYQKKQFSPIVAVASSYRARSHFDAQDTLESGLTTLDHNSGWLARACKEKNSEALAVARSVPLSLRGEATTRTWYPSNLKAASDDLYRRLEMMYAQDDDFSKKLQEGLETREMLSSDDAQQNARFPVLAKNCGELLRGSEAGACAMLEMGGWDTHNALVGRMDRQLAHLDKGIESLAKALGEDWKKTIVVVATEFGRTVKVNGTRGTDHGTASAIFILGGAVNKGEVLGQWPGLAESQLYQERDLAPTSDIREWLAALLRDHWHLNSSQLARVFPGVIANKLTLFT